jgi:hypothetical protein
MQSASHGLLHCVRNDETELFMESEARQFMTADCMDRPAAAALALTKRP